MTDNPDPREHAETLVAISRGSLAVLLDQARRGYSYTEIYYAESDPGRFNDERVYQEAEDAIKGRRSRTMSLPFACEDETLPEGTVTFCDDGGKVVGKIENVSSDGFHAAVKALGLKAEEVKP